MTGSGTTAPTKRPACPCAEPVGFLTQTSSHRQKIQRRPVHGVLLLDKPLGLSTNQALQKAKWLLRANKAGHTGTLDLAGHRRAAVVFGAATKFTQIQLDANKTYEAVLLLGTTTSIADAEGDVVETRPVSEITPALLQDLTARFTGPLAQVPPDVLGAQEGRQGALRIRPQGPGHRAGSAADDASSSSKWPWSIDARPPPSGSP